MSSITCRTVAKIKFTLKSFELTMVQIAQASSGEAAILVHECQIQFLKEPVKGPFHQRLVQMELCFR